MYLKLVNIPGLRLLKILGSKFLAFNCGTVKICDFVKSLSVKFINLLLERYINVSNSKSFSTILIASIGSNSPTISSPGKSSTSISSSTSFSPSGFFLSASGWSPSSGCSPSSDGNESYTNKTNTT